jgi:hypothetical protein
MDGTLDDGNKVVCCFCGKSLLLEDAVVLSVQRNIESKETQCLFCHKKHFIEKLDKSVVLHPDFFDKVINNE